MDILQVNIDKGVAILKVQQVLTHLGMFPEELAKSKAIFRIPICIFSVSLPWQSVYKSHDGLLLLSDCTVPSEIASRSIAFIIE
jgi:hypothetical protein